MTQNNKLHDKNWTHFFITTQKSLSQILFVSANFSS